MQLILLPAHLIKCWHSFDKTNRRNPILEHTHIEAPKEIKYQPGRMDTSFFWPELKQNKVYATWLENWQRPTSRPAGALMQDLHHSPLNCMLLMRTVLFHSPVLHRLLCKWEQGWVEGEARQSLPRAGSLSGRGEREAATQTISILLEFNHFWDTCSQLWVRCLDSVRVKGFRQLGTQGASSNRTFESIWKQDCRGFHRSQLWHPTAQRAAPPGAFRAQHHRLGSRGI